MLRSSLALIAGYAVTLGGVALIGWLMSNLFPAVSPGILYYPPEYLLLISFVAGLPGIVSGYLTALLARRAPVRHALALIFPVVILVVLAVGPADLLHSVRYSLYRLFLNPPHLRVGLVEVLGELHVAPITIGILIWSPAAVFGGCLRAWQVRRTH